MANRDLSRKAKRRKAAYARQRRQHDVATTRHLEEHAQEAAAHGAAAAESAARARWGARDDALDRLSQVGRILGRLRFEQDALVSERDELIAHLREKGVSWNQIASRTGLSRQALSKRVNRA
ncbi:hypothetical protein GCM10027568_32040 [Humibacter soli]